MERQRENISCQIHFYALLLIFGELQSRCGPVGVIKSYKPPFVPSYNVNGTIENFLKFHSRH